MKTIDWDKPLSEEDAKWIDSVGNRIMRRKLEENKARFSSAEKAVSEEKDPEEDQETSDNYDQMKVNELKEEAKSREDFDMSGIKTRLDLIKALREDDARFAE